MRQHEDHTPGRISRRRLPAVGAAAGVALTASPAALGAPEQTTDGPGHLLRRMQAAHPVEVIVHPGTYRETVTLWPGPRDLVLRGATGDPTDVVITYDKPASDWATLTVPAPDTTLADPPLENLHEDADGAGLPAYPLRSADGTTVLENVRLLGGEHEISDPRE